MSVPAVDTHSAEVRSSGSGVLPLPVGHDANAASDAELVARAKVGDARAFDELTDRYLDAAFAVAHAQLGYAADAEDVCQDAFLTALQRLEQCRDPDRFRVWLLRIVRNRAHNLRRYRSVRSEVGLDDVSPPSAAEDPGDDAARAELRDRINAALKGLPPAQRQVVLLFDLQGWSHGDIAESLGISEGASRAALFKARSALRPQLKDLMDPENEA